MTSENENNRNKEFERPFYNLELLESGRQDSNLRPSAPKGLELSNEISFKSNL